MALYRLLLNSRTLYHDSRDQVYNSTLGVRAVSAKHAIDKGSKHMRNLPFVADRWNAGIPIEFTVSVLDELD